MNFLTSCYFLPLASIWMTRAFFAEAEQIKQTLTQYYHNPLTNKPLLELIQWKLLHNSHHIYCNPHFCALHCVCLNFSFGSREVTCVISVGIVGIGIRVDLISVFILLIPYWIIWNREIFPVPLNASNWIRIKLINAFEQMRLPFTTYILPVEFTTRPIHRHTGATESNTIRYRSKFNASHSLYLMCWWVCACVDTLSNCLLYLTLQNGNYKMLRCTGSSFYYVN